MPFDTPQQLHASFLSAFNRGDLDELMALYEADATLLPQPGRVLSGLQPIREAMAQFLALKSTMTMTTTFSVQAGDLALLRGHWALTGARPDGIPVAMSGNSVEVARKQPDGIDHPFGAD